MAADLVTPAERRKLLADNSPRLGQVGMAFLEAGRWGEAIECLAAAGDEAGLARIREMAVEAGDLFFAQAAAKALGEELSGHETGALTRQAKQAGKDVFAAQAADPEAAQH